MGYDFELNDQPAQVHPVYDLDAIGLEIDGVAFDAQLAAGSQAGEYLLAIDGREESVFIATGGDTHFVHFRGRVHIVQAINALDRARRAAEPSGGDEIMRAPMPGTVVDVAVAVGEAVSAGQLLLTIESMKLQTAITTLHKTTVAEIFVAPGDTFDQGAALVRLEAKEEEEGEPESEATAKADANAAQQASKKEGQTR